jgi:hypothetical protein
MGSGRDSPAIDIGIRGLEPAVFATVKRQIEERAVWKKE